VVNIWIERELVDVGPVAPASVRLAGGSGKRHDVFRCARCGTTVWSRYGVAPGDALFVRAGTLDAPDAVTPDVHIFTRSRLPWVVLPPGVPAFESIYRIETVWSAESKARLRRNVAGRS
jgi:hypothetical protein